MNTRLAVFIAAVIVFLATLIVYVPGSWGFECVMLLTDGVTALVWIAGAACLGAVILRLGGFTANPSLTIATAGGLGLGIFSLAALGLGLLGWLNRAGALAMPCTGIVLFLLPMTRLTRQSLGKQAMRDWFSKSATSGWIWLIPIVSLATATVAASVMPGELWRPWDPDQYDVLSYHLEVPREWYDAGQIAPLDHNVFSYFPFNAEMQFLLAMHAFGGPWRAMYICQFICVGYSALMVLAVAGATEDRRAGAIAAAVVSCVPWVIMLGSVPYVESALMLYTALAVVWAMRPGAKTMALGGVMAGLAAGVKITAVPMLLLAVPIAAAIAFVGMSRKILIGCGVFLLAGILVLSPWLIRNVAWAGNPVFPVAMKTLGQGHFSDGQAERFRRAHSPTAAEQPIAARFRILWTDVLSQWQYDYVLLPAAVVAAGLGWQKRRTWVLLITGAIIFITWIGFTHLIARFLVMLIPIAGILIGQIRWKNMWPIGIVLGASAAAFGWTGIFDNLARTTRDPVRSILIGITNLDFAIPLELKGMKNSDKQVGLVGDAEAFLYQIPISRLHYRTVFDLPAGKSDPVEAWAGEKVDANWLLVINPMEIERLHRTYLDVPSLPKAWEKRGEEPWVMEGK